MRLAFYAPLKPPNHPVPSGDRRVAQLLMTALGQAGYAVELASDFRSYDAQGHRQPALAAEGAAIAATIAAEMRRRPAERRPVLWVTYHLYYKAPDWLGPRIASLLDVPYVVAEASVAAKRAGGPWTLGHEATLAALRQAQAVISLNPADDAGVLPHLAAPERLHRIKPFLDAPVFAAAARRSQDHRRALALELGLPSMPPWLLTVAMMRPGDKLDSYRLLAAALGRVASRTWQLIVIGDGPARDEVRLLLAPFAERVVFTGARSPDDLPAFYAAADLLVWPAINEAYGMALLEAQASGLPVLAGRFGGVGQVVADGESGILTDPGDAAGFAAALDVLLSEPERRRAMSEAALLRVGREHDGRAAGAELAAILTALPT